MNTMLHIYFAHELAAERRRDAERERLRRAALGAIPPATDTRRFRLPVRLRWPRPWTPRHAS